MEKLIEYKLSVLPIELPTAKLPRKVKKELIKVAGRDAYRDLIMKMRHYYLVFGYRKFKITKK